MATKTLVIISQMVDATIKEYQPDVNFKIFPNIDGLSIYLEKNPIRADILFFTRDVVQVAPASSFALLKDIILLNDYINVDRIIYITEEGSEELSSLLYLKEEAHLTNWDIVYGAMNRSFVQEVINGTYRDDIFHVNRKVVVRRPRADYVKEQLKNRESLDEDYVDDDNYLKDIPDEEVAEVEIEDRGSDLQKLYITGQPCKERTAFSILAAQYLSRTDRVLLLESDPEYHLVTEFITKGKVECDMITVTDLYEDIAKALDIIKGLSNNLVVIGCVDKIPFNYNYIHSLLYYNLRNHFDYIITECKTSEAPSEAIRTVVIPSTITDLLAASSDIDKSDVPYCRFVGVDMMDLPEIHVSNGKVLSSILNDVLTETNIVCPVVTVRSIRLGKSEYDLGGILGKGVLV